MAKLGLYVKKETRNVYSKDEDGNNELTPTTSWTRNTLYFNDEVVGRTSNVSNNLGVYALDGVLYVDGAPLVKSSKGSIIDPDIANVEDDVAFGKAALLGSARCINITLADYNKLLAGELVEGYKKFDPKAIYNIVPNVTNAPIINYINTYDEEYLLYNNIVGLSDNTLDDATFTRLKTPQISVHDFNPRVAPGEGIELTYVVDTYDLQKINHNTIGDTFTVIIRDSFDNILYKKTTYAGDFTVTLAPFKAGKNSEVNLAEGNETWFSVECIDNHHVGSAVRFYDVLIVDDSKMESNDPDVFRWYEVTTEILESRGIVPDDSDQVTAYMNKRKLEALFRDVKNTGYDGIRLYNKKDNNPTDDDSIYYINYHKDLREDQTGTPSESDFGTYDFYIDKLCLDSYRYNAETGVVVGLNGKKDTSYTHQKIEEGGSVTIDGNTYYVTDDGTSSGTPITPLEFIRRDGAHLCRVTREQYIGENHIIGTGASPLMEEDIDKIWVHWRDCNDDYDSDYAFTAVYDPDTQHYRGWAENNIRNNFRHLRTFRQAELNSPSDDYREEFGKWIYQKPFKSRGNYILTGDAAQDGIGTSAMQGNKIINQFTATAYCYGIENTADYDYMKLPDNFVIDLNGAVLQATEAHDLTAGAIIMFDRNFNTTVKNGKLVGIYKDYDFVKAYLLLARGAVGESVCNVNTNGSRFCSLIGIDSSWALCYEAKNIASDKIRYRYADSINTQFQETQYNFKFDKLGYIDYSGNIQRARITTPLAGLPDQDKALTTYTGTTYVGVSCDGEDLVYEETYHKCNAIVSLKGDFTDNKRADEFSLYGDSSYSRPFSSSKEHEVFVHFYDANKAFLKTVKTCFWYRIKIPVDAAYYRVSAYGVSKKGSDNYRVPVNVTYKPSTGSTWTINGAFFLFSWGGDCLTHSRNMLYKDCYWHDTRSTALSIESTKGVIYDNCTYRNIACIPRIDWFITKRLGACEDGRYKTALVTIKDCIFIRGHLYNGGQIIDNDSEIDIDNTSKPDEVSSTSSSTLSDSVDFNVGYCRDFTIKNCSGLGYTESSKNADAYLVNNEFRTFGVTRGRVYPNPQTIYRNNIIWKNLSPCSEFNNNVLSATAQYTHYLIRGNNSNVPVSNIISYDDVISATASANAGNTVLNCRRSKLGNTIYE